MHREISHPWYVPGPVNQAEMYDFANWLAARDIPHTFHLIGPDGSSCIETQTCMCQWERDWRAEYGPTQENS